LAYVAKGGGITMVINKTYRTALFSSQHTETTSEKRLKIIQINAKIQNNQINAITFLLYILILQSKKFSIRRKFSIIVAFF